MTLCPPEAKRLSPHHAHPHGQPFFESHLGGIERVAGHLSRRMKAAGAKVTWAASAQDAAPNDISAISLPCVNPTEKLSGLPMPIPGPRGLRPCGARWGMLMRWWCMMRFM
jgi:hypothetical protein